MQNYRLFSSYHQQIWAKHGHLVSAKDITLLPHLAYFLWGKCRTSCFISMVPKLMLLDLLTVGMLLVLDINIFYDITAFNFILTIQYNQ